MRNLRRFAIAVVIFVVLGSRASAVHDFTIDASKNPRTIDWDHPHLQSGKLGIYKIEGDTLVIAFGELGSKVRPTKFTSKLTAGIGRAGEVQTFKAKR